MRSICALVVVAGLGLAASASAADTEVPAITHLRATPSSFCAKKSATCHHPGTEVRFNVSTGATVRGDLTPDFVNEGCFVEFAKHFNRGANSIHIQDRRLRTGHWTLRLQGTNSVGSGGIAIFKVHVRKRG